MPVHGYGITKQNNAVQLGLFAGNTWLKSAAATHCQLRRFKASLGVETPFP